MDTYNSFFSASKIKVANFIRGKTTLAEAGFSKDDLVSLRGGLLSVLGGTGKGVASVLGNTVSFARNANGDLTGVFDKMAFAYPHTVGELLATVENAIAEKAKDYPVETVKSLLPTVTNGVPEGMSVSRARELAVKVLASKLGNPPQTIVQPAVFSAFSTTDLVATAKAALDGTFTLANLPQKPPASYNSAEVIELHQKLVSADPVSLSKVKLPESAEPISIGKRQAELPTEQTVHDFVADIILNKDTWSFDAASTEPGARIKSVLKDYAPEFKHISTHPELLDSLPEAVRADVKAIFASLAGVADNVGALSTDQARTLEAQVKDLITRAMITLQGTVTSLFEAQVESNADDRALWQHTFAEITGTGGIDPSTENGKFVCNVLASYFTDADPIEKRAMLSAFIRHTNKDSSPGRLVAELLKGAGPLLQKMLQGLPIASFGPETQIALKDMKSKLAPIPDDVIKAKLLELVRTSNGEILSIEVKKSIGAATVGQALLCTMRTKEHPVQGEEVVIKLLRPNVENAIQREFVRLREIAAQQGPAMAKSFEEQYAEILKELDFTLESTNVDIGRTTYEAPLDMDGRPQIQVRSMARSEVVAPSRGAMILAKVQGDTFGGYIERQTKELHQKLGNLYVEVAQAPNGPKKGFVQLEKPSQAEEVRQRINVVRQQGKDRREKLEKLISVWVDQALFGTGFINADMLADNAMVNDEFATVIDFGNALRLTPAQRDRLCVLMLSCLTGDSKLFMDRLGDFLPSEAKAGLEAKRDEINAELDLMLKKGTSKDVAKRLLAGMAVLQKHGVPVPASVNGFAASLTRLEASLAQFDDYLSGLDGLIRTMQFSPTTIETLTDPEEPIKKALPIFAKFDEGLMLFSGTQPMTESERDDKLEQLQMEMVGTTAGLVPDKAVDKFFSSDEFKAVLAQPDHGVGFMETFLEKYGQQRLYQVALDRSDLRPEVASFMKALEKYREHMAQIPAEDAPNFAAWGERRDQLQKSLARGMLCVPFAAITSAKSSLQEFGPLPAQRSFDSIVFTGVKDRLMRLGIGGLMKFASLGVTQAMGDEVLELEDEMRAYENRVIAAVAEADAAADLLEVKNTISTDLRRKLARAAENFCLPQEGLPAAKTLTTPEGRAKLLEILDFNVKHLCKQVGLESLTTADVNYYATVLKGVLKDTLVPLCESLDEPARAALQLEIGENANLVTLCNKLLEK